MIFNELSNSVFCFALLCAGAEIDGGCSTPSRWWKIQRPIRARVNFRPAGGFEHPPCGFSRIARKRRRAAPPGFYLPYSPSFWQLLWKSLVMQGHQVRSSDHTLQKLYNRAPATVFEGQLWNVRNMIRSYLPTKCISRIFYICGLESGHFRNLPIISQWAKIKLPVLCFIFEFIWMESHQVMYLLILQVKFLVCDPSKGHGGHSRSPTPRVTSRCWSLGKTSLHYHFTSFDVNTKNWKVSSNEPTDRLNWTIKRSLVPWLKKIASAFGNT